MSPQPQKPYNPSNDRHAYIPDSVQQAMTKQLEHAVPAHMKKYAGAYVQQNLVAPGGQAPMGTGKVSGPPPGYKPVTHLPRTNHFHQYKPQTPSKADSFVMPDQPAASPAAQPPNQPVAPPQLVPQQIQPAVDQAAPPINPGGNYDFFMAGEIPQATKRSLPGNSLISRLAIAGGGLVVLIVVFTVVKSLLAGSSALPYYTSVMQDQQALVHLSTNALQQEDLNTTNQNFAATAQLTLDSSQTDLTKLLTQSNQKVNPKVLNLKVSSATDDRLTTAAAGGTYNSTFKEVALSGLQTYMADVKTAFNKSRSAAGKNLLNSQYNQAVLMVSQLNQADAAGSVN
jgi:hypothetical protein